MKQLVLMNSVNTLDKVSHLVWRNKVSNCCFQYKTQKLGNAQETETHSDAPLSEILRQEKHLRFEILTSLKHFCM